MADFTSLCRPAGACLDLPRGHPAAADAVAAARSAADQAAAQPRPSGGASSPGSRIGRARNPPRLDQVDVLVFAGNHGVTAQRRFRLSGRSHRADGGEFRRRRRRHQPARTHGRRGAARHGAVARKADRRLHASRRRWMRQHFWRRSRPATMPCPRSADLVCLGEMGIGNTTAAAAIAAALFGGGGARWAGRGTGVDDQGLARKQRGDRPALARHAAVLWTIRCGRGGARRPRACRHSRRDARRRAGTAFRCCSTASSAPQRRRRS